MAFICKGGRFCEDYFLRYLDLCDVNPTYLIKHSLYYWLRTNQKLQEIVLAKSATYGVKSILLPLIPLICSSYTYININVPNYIQIMEIILSNVYVAFFHY